MNSNYLVSNVEEQKSERNSNTGEKSMLSSPALTALKSATEALTSEYKAANPKARRLLITQRLLVLQEEPIELRSSIHPSL